MHCIVGCPQDLSEISNEQLSGSQLLPPYASLRKPSKQQGCLQLVALVGAGRGRALCFDFASDAWKLVGAMTLDKVQVQSHLTTLANCHRKLWLVSWIGSNILHLSDNQEALTQDTPKHHMLVIQPVCLCAGDEELAAV